MTESTAVNPPDSVDVNVRNKNLKLFVAVLIGCIPLWLMSALIHLSDPDVSGIHEFASFSILFSVTLWMVLLFFLPMLIIIGAQLSGKIKGYVISLLVLSIGVSAFLSLISKSTVVLADLLIPSVVLLVVLTAATYPIVYILNRYY